MQETVAKLADFAESVEATRQAAWPQAKSRRKFSSTGGQSRTVYARLPAHVTSKNRMNFGKLRNARKIRR